MLVFLGSACGCRRRCLVFGSTPTLFFAGVCGVVQGCAVDKFWTNCAVNNLCSVTLFFCETDFFFCNGIYFLDCLLMQNWLDAVLVLVELIVET